MAAKKPANPFDSIATPKARKSKSTVTEIPSPNLSMEIREWLRADAEMKDAVAKKGEMEAVILPEAERIRLSLSQEKHENKTSVRLSSNEGAITVSVKNAYSAVPAESMAPLTEIFGDDYDRFFRTIRTITVKEDADLNALAEAVGRENLSKFFDVKTEVKPTDAFHTERSVDRVTMEKAARAIGSGLVKPNKPTVKGHRPGSDDED